MSRTTRRKNYVIESEQNSWRRRGKKTALEYTTSDYSWSAPGRGFTDVTFEFREMTKEEKWKRKQWFHGESSNANQRTPGRWYRQNRMEQNRSITRRELNRWMQYAGEYEPMVEVEPRSHYWDWS